MLAKFDDLVAALRTDNSLHLRVKIYKTDDQITIETGRDCPKRIINKIYAKCDKIGLKYDDICLCASVSCSAEILKSSIVGRPRQSWE